jgi:arylsulfatase
LILELAGVAPPPDLDGLGPAEPRGEVRSYAYVSKWAAETYPDRFRRELRSVEKDGFKLIVSSTGKEELYDLRADPAELRDLSAEDPTRVAELRRLLGPRGDAAAKPGNGSLDVETLRRLQELGYVH